MIRDLCRSPPSFKSNIVLSWKPTVNEHLFFFPSPSFPTDLQDELKRSLSENEATPAASKNGVGTSTPTPANKRARPEKQIYRPPTAGQKNRRGGFQRY